MKKTTVHIVPHTHWDREWYFQNTRATVYLISQVNEVIETLQNHSKTYFYLFDAQSSLLEDYLRLYPEKKAVLRQLISKHRLLFGPWYTQTDQLAISQESIVRNLYYGIDYAQAMGHSMKIGYCPDIFGQGGNLPQIYQKFGIHQVIFWRGIGNSKLAKTEFEWIGDDGTPITALQIPFGYFYGANIPTDSVDLQGFVKTMIPKLEKRSQVTDLYLPSCVFPQQNFQNKEQVIEYLTNSLLELDMINQNFIDSVKQREKVMATEIGNGVAIPHGSSELVKVPKIGVITLSKPIIWGKGKVDIIFLLALKFENRLQNKNAISSLYYLVNSKKILQDLRNAKTKNELYSVLTINPIK